jgi:pimeloyl-ACP methyl ester carboxylesterase
VATSALEGSIEALLARLPHAREEALAAVNGAFGDRLAAADSRYALPMRLFVGTERAPLREAPPIGRRICLLVHGLMGSQHAWTLGTEGGQRIEFGSAFEAELGLMPIYLRYNSGRHISHNGRELAERLHQLLGERDHPAEIDIVAHSMGGLVARSALHYASVAGMSWADSVKRVFMLGTPNHGARLEQLAHLGAFTLEAIWNPWTKLIGKAINLRSDGIKDLRHGFCLDADWEHKNQDTLRLAAPRPTRAPESIRWFLAAGQIGRQEDFLSRLLGDGLVRPRSAQGHGFGSTPEGVVGALTLRIFEGRAHLALMNEPEVLTQLIEWWKADEARH